MAAPAQGSRRGYPKAERFLVATTEGTQEKERENFSRQWQRTTGQEPALFEVE